MSTANIYQLIDSSLPIGGFVYSMGMESAIKSKLLTTEADLKSYLLTFSEQLISFDFPFLDAGFKHAEEPTEWKDIMQTYQAMLMNPNLEKSSLVLCKNWMRLLFTLYPQIEVQQLKKQLKEIKVPLHYSVVYGIFMKVLHIPNQQAREMFLYVALRDQVTALTRLGVVGPNGGQSLLTFLLKETGEKCKKYKSIHYTSAIKSAYIMEITQLNHHGIYSKLFQN